MTEFWQIALLGIGAGAVYGMMGLGMVVINRGSGSINFAHGSIALIGALLYFELAVERDVNGYVALAIAFGACAVIGALIQAVVMRPMRHSAPLVRVVATLGLLIVIESVATLRYGTEAKFVRPLLPGGFTDLPFGLSAGKDRLWMLAVGVVVAAALWALYRFTLFGKVTDTVAENELVAMSFGISPNRIAALNWALGCGLAGVGGALIAPLATIQISEMTLLVIPALAAMVVGDFKSFPITFAAAMVIGSTESLAGRYITSPGWGRAVPFIVVILWFVVRGRGLPLRDHVALRLPSVETGRVRRRTVVVWFIAAIVLTSLLGTAWQRAILTTAVIGIIALSIVVVTGYCGQLSLAPYALAGLGALGASRTMEATGAELLPSVLVGAAVAVPIGVLVAVPALRTRGVNLAIATLGLGVVVSGVVFGNQSLTGGVNGIVIGRAEFFGYEIDAETHAFRYTAIVLVVLLGLTLAVLNLRGSGLGRRLVAVRTNERAAASLGVDVYSTKLTAFTFSAVVASIGGSLMVIRSSTASFGQFSALASIVLVGFVVLGGVGWTGGGILAGVLTAGGVVSHVFGGWESIETWLPLVGGVVVIVQLIQFPDGMVPGHVHPYQHLRHKFARSAPHGDRSEATLVEAASATEPDAASDPVPQTIRVEAQTLRIQDLTVRFGGVRAVNSVSFTVEPGEVVGLIGPNGAGKTTIIDAITGFVRCEGSILLDERRIDGLRAHARSRAGLTRSFQSIELFDDLNVAENIAIASEPRSIGRTARELLRNHEIDLMLGADAIAEFGLSRSLDAEVSELSFGMRRLVGIARTVASNPSVVLLDEPAAGLDSHEVNELSRLVRRLADDRGMGVLLVEHHLDMVTATCDRIIVLDQGRVIFEGPPDEVLRSQAVREAYIGSAPASHPEPSVSRA